MDDVITQDNLLKLIERQRELNFEPGSEYAYSNSGYMLLAETVGRQFWNGFYSKRRSIADSFSI